ncbi:MAG: YraN family protein [Bacteroidota bacterium]
MAKHLAKGKKGEEIAVTYLEENGFQILETNWRHKKLEVDIIAMDDQTLVFVEVKTRSTAIYGRPEEFVDAAKEKHLARAAAAYMVKINHDWAIRFDVVAILLNDKNNMQLNHIKDAFFPGLE